MKIRSRRAVAAGGAFTIAASLAGLALTQAPALADVSGSSTAGIACLSNPGTPGGAAAAPFVVTAGTTLSSPVFPTGAGITATAGSGSVTVYVPGPIVQNYVTQLAGYGATLTGLGLGAVTVNLSGTNSTGALTYNSGVIASPTIQTITYTAGAANPLTFNLTGLNFTGTLTSNGSNGQTAAISVGTDPTNDGVGLAFQSSPSLTPGTGFGAWNGSLTGIAPGTSGATCTYDPSTAPDSTSLDVNLVDPPPVTAPATVNLGVGGTKTVNLQASSSDPTPATACNLVGTPSDPRLAVVLGAPSGGSCPATLTDSGSGPATVTFQYDATDGISTGNTSTVTVSIGTPPVDEPINQVVNPGQLVLSCAGPTLPVSTHCNTLDLPAITLNGVTQTTSGNGSTLYVSDNRGDPTTGWGLEASVVPSSGTDNTNASCAGKADFCNESVGTHALDASGNGQIAAGNLAISGISCAAHAGNLNPAAVADGGGTFATSQGICSAAAGVSGGTFDVTKTYTLTIPASVYAGTYVGTVEYLVS